MESKVLVAGGAHGGGVLACLEDTPAQASKLSLSGGVKSRQQKSHSLPHASCLIFNIRKRKICEWTPTFT